MKPRAASAPASASAPALSGRRVVVDQSPLVAATLAAWAFARWEELATPGVWQV